MIDRSLLVGTWQMLTWTKEYVDTGEIADVLGPNPVASSAMAPMVACV
jgi:hypothetical protein